jgi:hypothetical protein
MTSIFSRHRACFFRLPIVTGASRRFTTPALNAALITRVLPEAFLEEIR